MSVEGIKTGNGLSKLYRAQKTPDTSFYEQFKGNYQSLQKTQATTDSDTVSLGSSLTKLMGETYSFLADRRGTSENERLAYASILNKAYLNHGMDNPQGFLQSLSPAELAVIQREKSLAEPIQPQQLSKEGAMNLLLPTGYSVDLNRDGFEEVGLARTAGFPPRDAPAEFQQAWADTIDGMDEGDVMTYTMMSRLAIVGISLDPEHPNPPLHATDKLQSYTDAIANLLANLKAQAPYNTPQQIQKDQDFYLRLQQALGKLS